VCERRRRSHQNCCINEILPEALKKNKTRMKRGALLATFSYPGVKFTGWLLIGAKKTE
jgi:hypothetical protein